MHIIGINYYSFGTEEIGHACGIVELIFLSTNTGSVISVVNKGFCLEELMKVFVN